MEIKYYILLLFLTVAAFMDASSYKVRNHLIIAGLMAGLILSHSRDSLMGLIIPFAITFPLYAAHFCGAADVKLLSMAGLFLGISGLINCTLPILLVSAATAFLMGCVSGEPFIKVKIPFAVPVLLGIMPYCITKIY